MGVKVYISGMSGNYDVKKRQQRVMMILDSKHIPYQLVDITEPGCEDEKDFMHQNAKCMEGTKFSLPPQVFQDADYCGDYELFDLANENNELEKFLKLSEDEIETIKASSTPRASPAKEFVPVSNGIASKEASVEKEIEPEQIVVKESSEVAAVEEHDSLGAGGDGETEVRKAVEETAEDAAPVEETAEEPEEPADAHEDARNEEAEASNDDEEEEEEEEEE